jgi:guanylate kinase
MLVLLSGVSGAGKDTIKKELIARMDNVESLPSFTDRAPRENDIPGKTYNFVSTEEFEAMIDRGELYEYSAHHNHYYGTSRKLLNEKMQNGKIIVKDIEVNGVENLVKLLGNDTKIVTIFLKVPKEELRRRLESRIDKPSPKDIELRLNRLQYEESKIGIYDYVIKNNNLEKTVNIIMEIIKSEYNMTEAEF